MSAYTILMLIASPLGLVSAVVAFEAKKKWVNHTFVAILAFCIAVLIVCGFAKLAMSQNDDIVAERRAYREMVGRCEIDVYDDLGHINRDAAQYNIEISKIQNSIRRYGRWSTWYGTGAEDLTPITKEAHQ